MWEQSSLIAEPLWDYYSLVDYGRIDDCKNEILRKLPQLTYVDTVETTNEGLTYIKR